MCLFLTKLFKIILLCVGFLNVVKPQINEPSLKFEISKNRGFKVFLPTEPGLKLFTFNANINEDVHDFEETDIYLETKQPSENGYWTLSDNKTKLKVNDVINYWFYIQKDDFGRSFHNLKYKVLGFSSMENEEKPVVIVNKICEPSRSEIANYDAGRICKDWLIFEDNFERSTVDEDKWTIEERMPRFPDYEFVRYNENQVTIADKNLIISPTVLTDQDFIMEGSVDLGLKCTGNFKKECSRTAYAFNILHPVLSGKIISKPLFRYGKFEIRAKLPLGDWIYPEISLSPQNQEEPYSRLIIAFSKGNLEQYHRNDRETAKFLQAGYVEYRQTKGKSIVGVSVNFKGTRPFLNSTTNRYEPWGSYFHTYSLIWQPDSVTVAVDNQIYGTRQLKIDSQMSIRFGVGVGGINSFQDYKQSRKPWNNTDPKATLKFWEERDKWSSSWTKSDSNMIIDYVRVYAL